VTKPVKGKRRWRDSESMSDKAVTQPYRVTAWFSLLMTITLAMINGYLFLLNAISV
jgi:hypothetical protein